MTEGAGTVVSLADRIREALERDELPLPPHPELALRLRGMLESDSADASAVGELIKRDPAVTATLLRCANSALFGGLRRISDLQQAIARLGLPRVASLVTAIQVKGNFEHATPEKTGRLRALWDHSVASAIAARRLCGRLGVDAEEAFLAGLLHDCGQLVVLRGADHLESDDPALQITVTAIDELMDTLHCDLGAVLLKSWNLPDPLHQVALRHEQAPADGDAPLLRVVRASDAVARCLRADEGAPSGGDPAEDPALEDIELRDLELATLLVDIEDEFRELRGLI